jgi:hypothetical protein
MVDLQSSLGRNKNRREKFASSSPIRRHTVSESTVHANERFSPFYRSSFRDRRGLEMPRTDRPRQTVIDQSGVYSSVFRGRGEGESSVERSDNVGGIQNFALSDPSDRRLPTRRTYRSPPTGNLYVVHVFVFTYLISNSSKKGQT